ncbi:hypothetical protein IMG5_182970 [Ichthyophthirius multifiliis]|uniref:HSF-type DNA-binding domain-containing protein n=1 Tax=Ichthyophthirius multifiliis TaxID=5932 RepID=G0R336_ICHMU|nr:hypothetical protein IMG5_182970 [Ichthyophthirius multifiliis]EGR28112.1 hypothetical protein IMG5_182970 [Ichthyophthirius multifiliis]|eukprot:XP_004027457.1 hypothetical protein IMG5_182970 [Ichthyophthirius multifiliis]
MRKKISQRTNQTIPGFLSKTYKILENQEYYDIICWNDDGKAFKIKQPNELAEKVLPKYFKTNNFASFVRQLNMYDFHKVRHDSEENEWRHKLFRKGYPHLLCEIKRKIHDNQILVETFSQSQKEQNQIATQHIQQEILADNRLLWKKLFSIFLTYMGPKQIPELNFLYNNVNNDNVNQYWDKYNKFVHEQKNLDNNQFNDE